jgi:excinuclease ABC subunit B
VNSKVILYADKVTNSMQQAIEETQRRRSIQQQYNEEHGITPESIQKALQEGIQSAAAAQQQASRAAGASDESETITLEYVQELEKEMMAAAERLDFEEAAALRDRITVLRDSIGQKIDEVKQPRRGGKKRRKKGGSRVPRPKRQ